MYTPNEIAAQYVKIGKKKANMQSAKLFLLAIFAGVFIALGAVSANTAASTIESASVAKLVAAMVFPAGLMMVVIGGGELFTGNSLILISVLEKRVSVKNMLRNWTLVYIGNFVGALLIAWLVNAGHQLSLFNNAVAALTVNTAAAKTSISFQDAFLRGILCNILVCIAVWMGTASKDVGGRILAFFFPVMLFVAAGYEHCVANMYYVPAGLFAISNPVYLAAASADISTLTWGNFLINNLLPSTLGNIVGGGVLVGGGYWLVYLKGGQSGE